MVTIVFRELETVKMVTIVSRQWEYVDMVTISVGVIEIQVIEIHVL